MAVARIERLYALAEEIRRHAPTPMSATVLAEHFGVSRRTIERDLAVHRCPLLSACATGV